MKPKVRWLDVDWVYLGMLGWQIDETGAGYYGRDGGDLDAWNHIHLDRLTLDVMCSGSAEFLRLRLADLQQARVPGADPYTMNWTASTGYPITTTNWLRLA
jgi:hypothetical protein